MKITIMNHRINPDSSSNNLTKFANNCIGFFTNSDYWHTSIILDGVRYESGHPTGCRKTTYIPDHTFVDTYDIEVTENQLAKMLAYAERKLKENVRYNHHKLIILALVYPTRFVWNKLRWVPFQHDYFGMVCSVFVREILLAGDIDLFPELYKESTAPRDFAEYRR